jgi:hypothetical protein
MVGWGSSIATKVEGDGARIAPRRLNEKLWVTQLTAPELPICWSGRRELNPHHQLGRLELCH